jgi:acetyl-CoA C-acetyltransferase
MGHPLGATGCMILGTTLDELERQNKSTALQLWEAESNSNYY